MSGVAGYLRHSRRQPFSLFAARLCKDHPKRQPMPISNLNSGLRSATQDGQPIKLQAERKPEIGIFSTDREGNFLACNQAFVQLLGYESPELAGMKFTAIFSHEHLGTTKEDRKQPEATILAMASGQGHYQSQLCAKPKSGHSFSVNLSMTPMNGEESTPVGFVALVTPIAEP